MLPGKQSAVEEWAPRQKLLISDRMSQTRSQSPEKPSWTLTMARKLRTTENDTSQRRLRGFVQEATGISKSSAAEETSVRRDIFSNASHSAEEFKFMADIKTKKPEDNVSYILHLNVAGASEEMQTIGN